MAGNANTESFTTAAAVSAYRGLELTASMTAQHSSTAGLNPVVAISTEAQATVGAQVPGAVDGTPMIEYGGTITAGDIIRCDNAGKAVKIAATGEDYLWSIGVALSSGVSGDIKAILFRPNQASDISVIQ